MSLFALLCFYIVEFFLAAACVRKIKVICLCREGLALFISSVHMCQCWSAEIWNAFGPEQTAAGTGRWLRSTCCDSCLCDVRRAEAAYRLIEVCQDKRYSRYLDVITVLKAHTRPVMDFTVSLLEVNTGAKTECLVVRLSAWIRGSNDRGLSLPGFHRGKTEVGSEGSQSVERRRRRLSGNLSVKKSVCGH